MIAPLWCCKDYKVDSEGYILSKIDGHRMKPSKNKRGYLITTIMSNGNRISIPIHSAVAKSFLGDFTKNGMQINHKDGNKENNRLDNLEWVTPTQNMRHSVDVLHNYVGANHHNAKAIIGYDKSTKEVKYKFPSLADAAKHFCEDGKNYRIRCTALWRALKKMRNTYRGCIWDYIE